MNNRFRDSRNFGTPLQYCKSLFLLVLAAVLLFPYLAAAQDDTLKASLREIAEEMIREQGQVRVTGEVRLTGKHSDSYRDFLLDKAESLTRDSKYQYSAYEASFVPKGVTVAKDGATVRLLEHGILRFANPDREPGMPTTEEYEYEHEVRLVPDKNTWKVVEDRIVNLPRPAVPLPTTHSIPYSTLPYFVSKSEPAPEAQEEAQEKSAFSRTAAANYALQYWSSYNTSYRSFSPTDCTNFVSQAMRAGGWPDVTGFYQSSSAWWYNSLNQAWTWVNADMWADFTYNRPRATMAAYVSDLRVGDVLEADWDSDGNIDHAMIVTSKTSSDIFLTYHSNNQKDKPFSTILSENPGTSWYGFLLSSTVN